MNINSIFKPDSLPEPVSTSALIVNYARREVEATDWFRNIETEALAVAGQIQAVTNAKEQNAAVFAQASLARVIRAIQDAEEAAKKPLNELRGRILALSKQLQAKTVDEGNRIGAMISEFQIAEQNRAAALRRLQDEQAHALEVERDKRLSEAATLAEMDVIRDESNQAIAEAMAQVKAPTKAQGQVIREDWTVIVSDIWLLARAMPSCVKIEPRLSEIKSLLNAGVKVPGILAERVVKSGVRLGSQPETINI